MSKIYPACRPEDAAICPLHPGVMLKELYIDEAGLTVSALARALGVARKTIAELVAGKRAITPELSLRLGAALNQSPNFWMNQQVNFDMWHAKHKKGFADKLKNVAALF
ncbi:MAG: HigA family addiction module antidote protein [Planctomycetes bacterium]|nr:HigA family addiction module antidote protein [Planctomycetota bacterium]